MTSNWFVNMAYFIAAIVFIFGLKAMASPVTARKGVVWAGYAMIAATLATFFIPDLHNIGLMVVAIVLGGGVAWYSGKVVKMTDMPQMVAIYNGMGGGAAAGIAAIELVRGVPHDAVTSTLLALGAVIGAVAFSGSCVAFAKLQGLMTKAIRLPGQNNINFLLSVITIGIGLTVAYSAHPGGFEIFLFFVLALALGVILVMPIGGADMPVVISLLNAFTGLAVGFKGFVIGNPALIVAGIVVGASGMLLTQLMAKAMNRPIRNIIFAPITGAAAEGGEAVEGTMRELSSMDAAALMRYGQKVIIVPGYGMAVAGAQHKVWEMAQLLEEGGVEVVFAIHPVAGRMPGHMNVLLAEAGVPYDKIFDLDEINNDFAQADVALVIGANDVVNPVARTDKSSPIYGMPILNADMAQNVIVVKRGKGAGYSGIENALFYKDNCRMLYGSAQEAIAEVIQHVKSMEA
ncbi:MULTISPECIES: NAD(P)(+) transhydrogenase (Re/Si-specific) subunit beta [Thauera]|jgi:NAD(P) transhydrogenase subunit beta|uniref:NAD(P) transhydrogenase subunit beta n=1 Tax=Thauera aminoaromatica TaxID=164330 RepID=C4ZJL6_THASP|nr:MULTISPECIES: NAD(P)(+) transhydrogenase (Re/Si-specific) subunit beta [Thauera]OPZ05511.1 MAG: NAD(P) transhydrogenase subunit beta [Alphaproteobacteria bacterium ADurb.BinA305]ACK54398.1 NAD(P)(+) transhydrogenase (AB-specific) [Thauera aminoaromatica]MBP6129918.1 NAD(P)(+) transhydrogenase (Re/Si-specific) subunit beta [Thauera sp.]MBP7047586.1 NAD(P)(+) transhydrogenase (Re/Si-specific) subunit beta [Thauera sp.]MBX3684112.1 NAD(P)(+) transhydrogenase (Re/Si-specific) subunit beta [Thau